MGYDIHIKCHHPHTNIIGLGDSSSWKAPFLSRIPYMFFAPLLLPVLTPFIGIKMLVEEKQWKQLLGFLVIMPAGIAFHAWLIILYTHCSVSWGLVTLFAFRAALMVPYIHINIFQHIGLPMYSQENRPARIYQMATGSLNLSRNWFLDLTFGHSLINCHVEHHLFPRLSDNMCLKVKPVVSKYLQENGLPYHEDSYWDRLMIFLKHYDELMVRAPPVTHFIGVQ
jgi:fatty acid desaturase 6